MMLSPFRLTVASAVLIASTPLTASVLEFQSAYQDILKNTYELKAADVDIIAKEADRWQAGAYPNPELSVSLSSIGRDQGDDENQLFIGVTQLMETGGKRSARLRVAGADQCAARWNVETVKNGLFLKLLLSFINTAAAQERVKLAEEQQELAKKTLEAVIEKTKAGKISEIEEKKAQIAFRTVTLNYMKQCSNFQKAKKSLASLWDTNTPTFESVNFPLQTITSPPPLETLNEALKLNPLMIKAQAEIVRASQITALERSKRIPDIAIEVGVLTEKFTQQAALMVGVGIPLPLFDRNEGNISRASYEHLQSIYAQQDLENQLQDTLEILHHEWTTAYDHALIIRESLLPAANETYSLAFESYQEGKTDYLYLLDARSTLYKVQQQYLDLIEEYHHKQAGVFALTATYNQ